MELGSIVYEEKLIFSDGETDIKKNRPCIYLHEETINDKSYSYIMVLTSNTRAFNKYSYKHVFIPETIYNYRRLSFAQLDNIVIVPTEKLIRAEQKLSQGTIINVISRMNEYTPQKNKEIYIHVRNILNETKEKQKVLKKAKSA